MNLPLMCFPIKDAQRSRGVGTHHVVPSVRAGKTLDATADLGIFGSKYF